MSEATPCKSCGRTVVGMYCAACGEKVLTPDDHTLKHYLEALLNAFTFADSKLWNTLKAIVVRPGELSASYMDGRRVKYMRPVAFFFLANFIYFLAPVFETFNTRLNSQLHHQSHSQWALTKVEAHLSASGLSMEEFTALYDPASSNNAKLLVVVVVFALSIPIAIIYFRKQAYISAYITGAFELMAFHLWVTTITLGAAFAVVTMVLRTTGQGSGSINADTYLFMPLILLHLWATIGIGRRFFGCTWAGAAWRAAAMLFGLQFALSAYRLLLFAVTMWSIGA